MQDFLIATSNPGKFREISTSLEGLPYRLVSLAEVGLQGNSVEETGKTYEENALLKAQYFFDRTDLVTLGEDSGLEVDALGDALGVQTRRWGAGENATDEAWLAYFLNQMRDFLGQHRHARFVCYAVLILPNCPPRVFSATAEGMITPSPEAPLLPGLPLSSVFKPDGFDRVYAALTPQEKIRLSHRGRALAQVRSFLESSIPFGS